MLISIVNGPNLNLLGKREKDIYGTETFESFFEKLSSDYQSVTFRYFQSNIEGELVNLIQDEGSRSDGIILNAAGYTHSSVSIADAVAAISIPVIEVHISNILNREEYRHKSLIAAHSSGCLFGFGLDGYRLAVEALLKIKKNIEDGLEKN